MSALQHGNYNVLDRSNGQNAPFSTSMPLNAASPAPLKLLDESFVQRDAFQPAGPDGFAYYQDLVDSSTFSDNDADSYSEYDDGYNDCIVTGLAELGRSQFLDRPGGVPCNLAARLANRSNGPPLATIMEQHSRSTLNSPVSLLSMGRVASLHNSEHASPRRGSQKKRNNLGDTELSKIPENVPPKQHPSTITETRLANESRGIPPMIKTQNQANEIPRTNTADSQTNDAEHTTGGQRLSAFFRDVLHTVQNTSRARPWSSPLIQATTVNSRDDRAEPIQRSPRSHQHESDVAQCTRDKSKAPRLRDGSTSGRSQTPLENPQTRNRQICSSADVKLSARADPPLLTVLPYVSELGADTSLVPHLLPPSVATRSSERYAAVHPVQPKPREEVHNGDTAEVLTLSSERRSDTPVHDRVASVSVHPGNAPSLAQCDRAIESSRNASFCSTMSTTYSGTVLGVDLDLEHELVGIQNLRRSRSPTPVAPPVWFTPQMAELERQASVLESPEQTLNDRSNATSHSVKSFALTSLLPIAAASGIVTPNYNTPKISFYSPSGNLIQPDSSSSPAASSSEFNGSPTLTTSSYYNIRSTPIRQASPTTTCLPPVRPALVPMTTPPTSSAPLPAHLQHHHNYRHPEKSQIEPTESFILPSPAVRGCGGMVKSPSFTPRSGVRHQHKKFESSSYYKHHRSVRSIVHDLKFEARFYKAGLVSKACTSCGPTGKGKVLRKRHLVKIRADKVPPSSYKKNNGSCAATTVVAEEKARMSSTSHIHAQSTLGPLAGHTLRICFCQPYDGAGRLTHNVVAEAPCISISRSASNGVDQAKRDRERVIQLDSELPNARVISKETDRAGQGEKKAAIGRSGGRARTRSDSVVSIGVGLRVAAVGA